MIIQCPHCKTELEYDNSIINFNNPVIHGISKTFNCEHCKNQITISISLTTQFNLNFSEDEKNTEFTPEIIKKFISNGYRHVGRELSKSYEPGITHVMFGAIANDYWVAEHPTDPDKAEQAISYDEAKKLLNRWKQT